MSGKGHFINLNKNHYFIAKAVGLFISILFNRTGVLTLIFRCQLFLSACLWCLLKALDVFARYLVVLCNKSKYATHLY